MSFKHLSEKTFAFMEMESYEELTARLAKALADLEARVDEYQELEKDEAELVAAHEAKLAELKAMCHEKNKNKKEMMEDIKSLEKRALKLKKMWEEKVKRDKEALATRGRGISEKMPKAADVKTESNADEETEDKSSTPTLVCTFLKCIFKFSYLLGYTY